MEKNLANQECVSKCIKVIPDRISKANMIYNAIISQTQHIEWLKQEIKFQDNFAFEKIYFYK